MSHERETQDKKVDLTIFQYKLENMGPDASGFQVVYTPNHFKELLLGKDP